MAGIGADPAARGGGIFGQSATLMRMNLRTAAILLGATLFTACASGPRTSGKVVVHTFTHAMFFTGHFGPLPLSAVAEHLG